jgi:hypothetical protein
MGEDGLEVDVVVAEAVGVDEAVHVRDLADPQAAELHGRADGEARDVAVKTARRFRMGEFGSA